MPRYMKIAAASFLVIILISASRVWAENDPPGRVARLSYISGDVSFQPGGVDDWTDAKLNRPMTTGDRLWTARDARTEMHIGTAALRLNGETSFTLSNLDDRNVQISLAQGSLEVRVRKLYGDETFEIDTPNLTLNLLRDGNYRVDVDNDHDVSWVTVRSGSAEANGSGQAVTVKPGQQVKFAGGQERTYDVAASPAPDGFDQWCDARDIREERAQSARYVSREMIGYEDLDDYGSWRTYDSYGAVWVPVRVTPGWAPYRYGHWDWVYPWGWTWVDDAPWGFAPFHYGRWVYAPFGWAWVPGPIRVRPVYAPALVAWIGGRSWGVGLSFGGGLGYGWMALGPREPFIPWYRGSRDYWSRVNVHNTVINNTYITNVYNTYNTKVINNCRGDCDNMRNITNINYRNRLAPNGVTVVGRDALVSGRPISQSAVRLDPAALKSAPVMSRFDEAPSRSNALGGHERAPESRPPQRAFERPVVTRTAAPKPVPFEAQTRAFRGDAPERDRMKPQDRVGDNTIGRTEPRPEQREIRPGESANSTGRPNAERNVPRPDRDSKVAERGVRPDGPNAEVVRPKREVPRPPERDANAIQRGVRPQGNNPEAVRPKREVPRPPENAGSVRDTSGTERKAARTDNVPSSGRVPRPSADESAVRRSSVPQPRESVERTQRPANIDRSRSREPEMAPQRTVRAERTDGAARARSAEAQRPARAERSAPAPKASAPAQHAPAATEKGHTQHR